MKPSRTASTFQSHTPSSPELNGHQSGWVYSSIDHPRTALLENGMIPTSLIIYIILFAEVIGYVEASAITCTSVVFVLDR